MKSLLATILLLIVGCGSQRHTRERVQSPSGDLFVSAIPNDRKEDPTKYRCIRLIVTDTSGETLSEFQTGASDYQKWAVGWTQTGNVIVLFSSDIGTQAYSVKSTKISEVPVTPDIENRAKELKREKYGE